MCQLYPRDQIRQPVKTHARRPPSPLASSLPFPRATARSVNPGPPKRERDSHSHSLMRGGRVPRGEGGRLICFARLLQEAIPSSGAAEKHKSWDDLHTAAKRSWLGDKHPSSPYMDIDRLCYADWPAERTGLADRTNRPAGQGFDTFGTRTRPMHPLRGPSRLRRYARADRREVRVIYDV